MRRAVTIVAVAWVAALAPMQSAGARARRLPAPAPAADDANPIERPRGRTFGFVERREVVLSAVHLLLGEARRCRAWPRLEAGRSQLGLAEVRKASCRVRRYDGPVSVTLVDARGRAEPLPPLRTDANGRITVDVAQLDAAARYAGHGSLRDYAAIELGDGGWAGRIDLRALHGFLADWHLRWVAAGRGAPGLFAIAHPDHRGVAEARALAVEAQLARQRVDYEAVVAGRLPAQHFLARYPWSPFRREVERLGHRP